MTLGKGVAGEQVAEVVRRKGKRNGKKRKHGEAQHDGADADGHNGQPLSARQPHESLFDAREPFGTKMGQGKGRRKGDGREGAFKQQERGVSFRGRWQEHTGTMPDRSLRRQQNRPR